MKMVKKCKKNGPFLGGYWSDFMKICFIFAVLTAESQSHTNISTNASGPVMSNLSELGLELGLDVAGTGAECDRGWAWDWDWMWAGLAGLGNGTG